jgi:NitT/TauT family transport system substrate-binding protein
MKRSSVFIVLGLAVGALLVALYWNHAPKKAQTRTIGLVTWIGYGPLFIAQEQGYFEKRGIDVDIRLMDGPGERESAYLAGKLDFFPNTPDAFAIFFANQPTADGKIVAALDQSIGADGVVAKEGISSIKDLKGKSVGFQLGITSHFLLLCLLDKAGMKQSDITTQNMEAGEAGAAFVAGKLDAAVTWEPWLSKSKERVGSTVLATSKDTPGLLVDLLLASDRMLSQHPDEVIAFIDAWQEALQYLKQHPEEGVKIIASKLKLSPADAKDMLATTAFMSKSESEDYLRTGLPDVIKTATRLYRENKVISTSPDFTKRIVTDLHSTQH